MSSKKYFILASSVVLIFSLVAGIFLVKKNNAILPAESSTTRAYDYSFFEQNFSSFGISYQKPYGRPYISPDERFIVFVAERESGGYFYHGVVLFDTEKNSVKVLGTGYLYGEPSWSGNTVAVAMENGIVVFDAKSGVLRRLGEKHKGTYSPSFSPDGTMLLFSSSDGLVATELGTSEERMITTNSLDRVALWENADTVFLFRDVSQDRESVEKKESIEKFVFSTGEFAVFDYLPQQKMISLVWLSPGRIAHLISENEGARQEKVINFDKKNFVELPKITDPEKDGLDVYGENVLLSEGCLVSLFSLKGKEEANMKLPVLDEATIICGNVSLLPEKRILYETYNTATFKTVLHVLSSFTSTDTILMPETTPWEVYALSPSKSLILFVLSDGTFRFERIDVE